MKKVLSYILVFIFGIGITTFAYSYNAKDISYTPSNSSWKVGTVKGAIDDLKTNGIHFNFGTPSYSESLGTRIATRETSQTLNKGKYLVEVIYGCSAGTYTNGFTNNYELSINTNKNIKKTYILGKVITATGSSNRLDVYSSLYYIEVLEDTTTISLSKNDTANAAAGSLIEMQVAKMQ